MKKLDSNTITISPRSSQEAAQEEISIFPRKRIDQIFARLLAICSGSMAHARKDPEHLGMIKAEWFRAFRESSVRSQEQLEIGYRELRSSGRDFLPNPGRFIQWCENAAQKPLESAEAMLDLLHEYHICKQKTEQFGDRFPNKFRPLVHEMYSRINYRRINTDNGVENLRVIREVLERLQQSNYQEPPQIPVAQLPTPEHVKKNMTLEQVAAEKKRNETVAKQELSKLMESLR